MSDDEIRRDVLARAGWEPHEIDRWLAENPKPRLLAEQVAILAERLRDLGRALWQERRSLLYIVGTIWFATTVVIFAWELLR